MSGVVGEEDLTVAWSYAANCSLYEEDPGPPELNIGSSLEPHWVSRVEALSCKPSHPTAAVVAMLREHPGPDLGTFGAAAAKAVGLAFDEFVGGGEPFMREEIASSA